MEHLRVAAASLNLTPLNWQKNTDMIIAAIKEGRNQSADLLVLPELCMSGYGAEDAFYKPFTSQACLEALKLVLEHTQNITVTVGLPFSFEGKLYNCVALLSNGKILGINAKKNLPVTGLHYEGRWFSSWAYNEIREVEVLGQKTKLGDLHYLFSDRIMLYVEICEEAWVTPPSCEEHSKSGCRLVINSSASHFARSKFEVRKKLISSISKKTNSCYVYANLIGNESGRAIYDGGNMFVETGEIVQVGARFGFEDVYLSFYDFPAEKIQTGEKTFLLSKKDTQSVSIDSPLGISTKNENPTSKPLSELNTGGDIQKEFLLACSMGLFDYLRKSRSKGFVLSLSGGCDSSCCAFLVSQMYHLAFQELGKQKLASKLESPAYSSANDWVRNHLTCIYQKTSNNSETTEQAAKKLSEALSASYFKVEIDDEVTTYTKKAESILARKLDWSDDDVTLQNIQARSRAPLPWMIANARNFLLLSTSNRSEAAVGYATMDGDTAGSLSPIAGVDKHFLISFLHWAQTKEYILGSGPEPVLKLITDQQATAELRPLSKSQTDEIDLMPYDVLCRISNLFISDDLSPAFILQRLEQEFQQIPPETLKEHVRKFFRLFSINQWKRERYAPSFHLDDTSVDPKTFFRFPILNSGFQKEIEQL